VIAILPVSCCRPYVIIAMFYWCFVIVVAISVLWSVCCRCNKVVSYDIIATLHSCLLVYHCSCNYRIVIALLQLLCCFSMTLLLRYIPVLSSCYHYCVVINMLLLLCCHWNEHIFCYMNVIHLYLNLYVRWKLLAYFVSFRWHIFERPFFFLFQGLLAFKSQN
jgi:hypothetical protein